MMELMGIVGTLQVGQNELLMVALCSFFVFFFIGPKLFKDMKGWFHKSEG